MLQQVFFENFKALRQVDVDLSPLTLLVGKNNAGKTSVLEGIYQASRVGEPQAGEEYPAQRLRLLFSGAWDARRLITQPGEGPLRLGLRDVEGRTFRVEAYLPRKDEEQDCRFVMYLTGQEPPEVKLPGDEGRVVKAFLAAPELRRFTSAVLLHLDASVMVKPSVAESEQPWLEHNGEGLASVLNYFAGAEPALLEAVAEDLAKIVPEVRGIRTFPVSVMQRRQERIVIGEQAVTRSFEEQVWGHRFSLDMGHGRLVPADLLSKGTVLALGLLVALRHPRCPRLVLADDIDQALHPAAQAELIRCIRSILEDKTRPVVQLVCTTHSPDLVDHVALDEVRVMALDAQGHAVCRRLSAHPESERWSRMLRTGEFWASVGEDWLVGTPAHGS